MKIFFAPMQGFTDFVYRNLFKEFFLGVEKFFTPFLRVENSQVRKKDIIDIEKSDNYQNTIPQLIANSKDEVEIIAQEILKLGFENCDINFGCPFPQQTFKKRGAGILTFPDKVAEVLKATEKIPELKFSIKMRLGNLDKNECLNLVDIINDTKLEFVTIHPRISKQMYNGEIQLEMFSKLSTLIQHPIVYNGDLKTKEDIQNITTQFPNIKAVMIGRGLLADPFLAQNFESDKNGFDAKIYLNFFNRLIEGYLAEYQNSEVMALNKIKTFLSFAPSKISTKHVKTIQKVRSISQFISQLAVALNSTT